MKRSILALAVAVVTTGALNAANVHAGNHYYEEITIIGSKDAARLLPGSGSVIGRDQIEIESANDINQLLKTVPVIYI